MEENARRSRGGSGSGKSSLSDSIASATEEVRKAVAETKRTLSKKDASAPDSTVVVEGETERIMGRKKGGKIPRTGIYKLHRGEFVIPAKSVKRLEKRGSARRSGRR
jgi:ABC-type dipeptide/oligopeptide/nickel transport system ATPase component